MMMTTRSWKTVRHSCSNHASTDYVIAQASSAPSNVEPFHIILSSYRSKNMNFVTGETVELKDGDFLRLTQILCNLATDEVFLNGKRLRRTRNLSAYISRKVNEVCWVEDECRDGTDKAEKVPVECVIRLRRLRMTNKSHEDCSVSHFMDGSASVQTVNNEGPLFCRWKFITVYANQAAKKKAGTFVERVLRPLDPDEVDENWLDEKMVARPRRMSSVTLVDDEDPQEVQDIL